MKTFQARVPPQQDGQRLDVYLAGAGLELSRRKIRQVIDVGGVYVNKKRVRMASRAVRSGDQVRVEYSEDSLRKLRAMDYGFAAGDVLYEEHQVVAVNKPPGMPAQATRDQSVLHAVSCLAAFDKERGVLGRRYVLVHRLDKETSGVLLIADGNERATWLTDQFRERKVEKTYLALCHGLPKERVFTERSPLSEIDKKTGDVRAVRSGGRSAVTRCRVVATSEELELSLVECKPETGRSHQIRVHLLLNGLPIVGDKRYVDPSVRRRGPLRADLAELAAVHHFLHARRLAFDPAPGVPRATVEAPLPERFRQALAAAGLTAEGL